MKRMTEFKTSCYKDLLKAINTALRARLNEIQNIPGIDRPLRKGDVRLIEAKIAVYDGKKWVEETEKEAGSAATSGR